MRKLLALLALALLASPALAQPDAFRGPAPTRYFSGSITVGGTFQQIVPQAQNTRKSVDFINICNITGNCTATTNYCYIYFNSTGGTTALAIPVGPGVEYLRSAGTIPGDAVRATCDGTGDKFYMAVQ